MDKKKREKPAKKTSGERRRAKTASAKHAKLAKPKPASGLPRLGKLETKKIQNLFRAKTAEGVSLRLSLLQSLDATTVDYEAVFTKPVMKTILAVWADESWIAVAKALAPYRMLSKQFQELADEKLSQKPIMCAEFREFLKARLAAARAAFIATRGGAAKPGKPFINLIKLPPGAFMMGGSANEEYRGTLGMSTGNTGQVQVRITKPFDIGQTAVTQEQWRAVMGTEPWRYIKLDKNQCGSAFPVIYVSWEDATLFCQTLTDLEHELGHLPADRAYRLPTEAQWEYACRAGTQTAYSFGNNPDDLDNYGWHSRNSGHILHEVAQKSPNPWQLYDMHGNVFEWCADCYGDLAGGDDPPGPPNGITRVFRGGSYGNVANYSCSAYRDADIPHGTDRHHGFRVVCSH
jgi:formylglycine-generating enzyme required for sulfatase activity